MAWQGSKSVEAQTSQTTTTEPTGGGSSINVSVGGLKLSLKSDKDPRVVADIAAYVDEKVAAVREAAPSVSLEKAMMLASLTVAEELFDAQARVTALENALRQRVDNCLAALDALEAH